MTASAASARASTAGSLARPAPLHADLSPDGRSLLLTTVEVPLGTEDEVVRLVELDTKTGEVRRTFPAGYRLGTWSPDGKAVAAICDLDGGSAVATVGGDHPGVVESGVNVVGPAIWSPDGSKLAFPARSGRLIDRTRPYRWTRPLLTFDGTAELEDPPGIAIHDLGLGHTQLVVDDGWRWSSPRWSPDAATLVATASLDPTGATSGQYLWAIDVVDGGRAAVPIPGGRWATAAWLSDGRLAAVVAEPRDVASGGGGRLYVVDGDQVVDLGIEHVPGDVYGDNPAEAADNPETVLLATGNDLVVRTGRRGRMGVAVVAADGDSVREIVTGDRCSSPVAVSGRTLVMTVQSADHAVELAMVDIDGGAGAERRLTRLADEPCVAVTRFEVDNDSRRIDAWLVRPSTAGPGTMPTVVLVHGGPHFAFGESFSFDVHALCAAGFAVLYPNVRGSTGYGDEFAWAVHGDWSAGPASDLLAVLDSAISEGWVDGDRVGIAGNSYGGYLAAWLVSTTSRFRAAVIENPVTDLIGMYATSDIGMHFFPAQFGGPPWERPEVYVAQSPLHRAHGCRTPTLFVVGELDRRCPSGQALAMHRVLCDVGTPSEVLVLPGASHEGSTYGPPAGRLAHDEALAEWMSRWLE